MLNVLFIHQSAEMYGSDKTLLLLLTHIDRTKFNPVVIIPEDGSLKDALADINIKIVIAPIVKLYRNIFTIKNLFQVMLDIKTGIKVLDKLHLQYNFDIVYSNTLAVLLGFIYAKKRKIKHLWHVHEIIESPIVIKNIFIKLLAFKTTSIIVYNSVTTQKFWNVNLKISDKSVVILNGIKTEAILKSRSEISSIRDINFHAKNNDIIIALVGRISRWKGHLILLQAFYNIISTNSSTNLKLVFIGTAPSNQDSYLHCLKTQITNLNLNKNVKIIPFQENISEIWQSIDIAIVPSTEPEPFGLVAIEAMLAKKPVIASNHGGLTEIIVDNITGFLFEPRNDKALSSAILKLIDNPNLRVTFGENGHQRVLEKFSIENHVKQFEQIIQKVSLS